MPLVAGHRKRASNIYTEIRCKRFKEEKKKIPSLAGEGTSEETRSPHCPEKDKPVFGLQASENGFLKEEPCTIYTETG